ncbi:CD209 antigen-like protein E [Dicentrarchus labrax]|uniref:CD209 antigen-like protein E n=1 Tax=Dicentrarchus labrax TaxID=13489 RepID=UPI0021F5924D|nr:CD209 antigen-like protein E [Dicentrarchus labrax]
MDEIYMNVKPVPSKNQTVPRSSERRSHGVVVLCLGLLSVLLLAGLISLGVHYHVSAQRSAAELSSIKANLMERLQASDNKSSSLTAERDWLNASLVKMTEELNRLRGRPTCPTGWRMFKCVCYLLSNETGSWEKGKEDCGVRGAGLVVISSTAEQMFLSNFTREETHAWIGLTDKDKEGTWKWIDGGPLTDPLKYWREPQPDNGGGYKTLGEEDCAHIIIGKSDLHNWNDLSCNTLLRWICMKRL